MYFTLGSFNSGETRRENQNVFHIQSLLNIIDVDLPNTSKCSLHFYFVLQLQIRLFLSLFYQHTKQSFVNFLCLADLGSWIFRWVSNFIAMYATPDVRH